MKKKYIYSIVNETSKKTYIGESVHPITRWAEHLSLLKNQKHTSDGMQQDWNGSSISDWTFRIIEEVAGKDSSDREAYWIEKLNADYLGYNTNKVKRRQQKNRILALIGEMTYREIAEKEKVSLGLIAKIKKEAEEKL